MPSADESAFAYRDLDERSAAAMCFTSGTTGLPKGVLYSHRAIALHALTAAYLLGVNEGDTILPVVPMFHANAWCFPFTCCLVGAKQVFPGPHLDPESLLEAFEQEKVTLSAGVPTIWMGILQALDATPDRWDLSAMRSMTVGGSAPPRAMLEAFGERHGLKIVHGWGMTEMCPIGTMSGGPGQELGLSTEAMYDKRAQQGTGDPVRRDPCARRRRAGAVGRQPAWASSRCAARRSPRPTTRRRRRPTAGRTTAGSAPATSSRSAPTGTSRSRTARRTSSSRAASGSPRSRSRTR